MDGDLRNMVMSFRVTELQTLLGYAGKNRSGRKNELQARALDLVKNKSSPIVSKIKELYRQSMAAGQTASVNASSSSYGSSSNNGAPHTQTRLFQNSTYNSEKVLQGLNNASMYAAQKSQIKMPICPDVKMKRLPFYDVTSELIKPNSLQPGNGRVQEASFSFCLTPQQAADIAESKEYVAASMGEQKLQYTMQVQLRFCSIEPSVNSKEQDDQFPPSLIVKVNNRPVTLPHPIPSNRPGVEPKRPSRPLNVTNLVRLSPTMTNTVTVTWASDNTRGYAISLYLVKKLTSSDLMVRLKQKGVRPADYSRGLIKELIAKDDGDCMIAMTSLKVSISCPLGKCRMSLPCRATTCKHLQCFDANLFLQMNERKPTWVCPVCDKPTLFDDLCIDGYFQDVISKMERCESMDVELLPDGSWKTITTKTNKKDKDECSPPTKKIKSDTSKANTTINLDDDIVIDEDVPFPKTEPSTSVNLEKSKENDAPKGPAEVITIESSDSDSDSEVPVRPRRRAAKPNYVIEDDSSSSSSTSDGSAATLPASPVRPMSPACITLDSRSPSPEVPVAEPSRNESRSKRSSSTNSAHSSGTNTATFPTSRDCLLSSAPASTGIHNESRSNSATSFDYGHTLGQPSTSGYTTRSNSTHNQPLSQNPYAGGPGYMPYDGPNCWGTGSSANFPNTYPTPDFSQLDYNQIDYFNYDSTRTNNPNYRWP